MLPARVLHWLMAAGFVFMWICGFYMTRFPEDDSPLQGFLYGLHISVGVTLLALLAARIAVRMRNTPPALPVEIPPLERRAAELGHIALYVLPLAVIALGYAQTNLKGYAVKWFGLELPSIFDKAGEKRSRTCRGPAYVACLRFPCAGGGSCLGDVQTSMGRSYRPD